ncbi:MAG: hypothetical protein AB7S56_08510 [Halothiobacillaceae bacterium]
MKKELSDQPVGATLLSAEQLKPLLRECLEDEDMLNWLRKLLNAKPTDDRDSRAQAEVMRVQKMLREQEAVLLQARANLTQKDGELTQLKERLHQAEQRERETKAQFEALRKQGALPTDISAILRHVRADARLVSRFVLDIQADDVALLVQVVAVLSQAENFKRLWELYKTRCVERRAALEPEDRSVLHAALAWHNANWKDAPYTFIEPAPNEAYNYEQHTRPPAMAGDRIAATWLPGVPRMKIMPLVETR